ncbi:hypothetical protein BD324DRAFT_305093 [Kockovaella imperatae]|uniref:Uncharacterized protein n=1 Tax=Kockovaella imperatae TaxID=4999 RepID=A0A1Y1ULV2_9TREE|nr:hypothetical protein BD324DRAFT_305093 [Kockovaella imperatae]ORX39030.1 hypothetical protein BD324DRAFT_305093 [Kockovaella imperatae]
MDATDDIPTPPDHKDSQGKVQVPPLSPMKPRERQSVDPLAVPSDVWGEEPAAKTVKGSDRATPKSTEETPEDKVPSDEAIADNETRSSSKRHEKDTAGNGEERSALTDGKPPPDRRTTEPSIDGPKNGAEEEKADGQDTETSAGQPRKASTEGNSSKRSREKNKEHLSDIDELGSARVTKFGHENRRGLERVQKSDKKPDKVRTRRDAPPNTSKELADTTNNLPLSQASRRTGLRQIIRATWRTISLAPIWSFATLMSAIIVLMGDRQLAQMIINSHSSAAVSRKRALAPDLALTEKINNKDFSTLLSPTEFFILLNIWNFLGLLILSILISATIGGAQRPSLRNTRHTIAKALSGIANILLMGARPRGLSIISRSSWTSYGRLAMFLALLTLVILILQQALAFAFSATSTPNALLDATPDIAGIEKLSHTISAGQILLALMFILAIIIPALTFGWYALLNPPSKTATKDVKADQQLKTRNTRTIMALEAIGAIVILTVFLAVMYFFSEIVAYSGTGSSNLIIANVILVFMIPATGWALIVLSRAGGRIYRSGSRSLFGNDPEKSLV